MNWQKLITEINDSDLSDYAIEHELKRVNIEYSQSSINRLKNTPGKQPPHDVGEALICLHQSRCKPLLAGAA